VYSYSAAIGDSVVDSMIFALPIPYVWRLSKLRLRQRLGLMLIFGLGFIVCVVALLQIPFMKRREGDTRYFGSAVNMLIAIQITFAVVAASLPDLRALVARNFPNFSPLHHRSLITAGQAHDSRNYRGRVDAYDVEHDEEMAETPRVAFEGKRVSRKPDWLRDSIPASLMSTTITHNEVTHLYSEELPQWPQRSHRAAG
jgi:heme/copper-type cytochrome/quinol oxidase subunit 4